MNDHDIEVPEPCKVILLATDGSEFSAGVERVGMEMAVQNQSHLHVLRLLLTQPGTDEAIVEEQDAIASLEQIGSTCTQRGINHTPVMRRCEEPAPGILTVAREIQSHLIIIGRRGRRGLAKHNVGEATTRILDKQACSVLVVPRLFSFWSNGVLLVIDPDNTEGDRVAMVAIQLAKSAAIPLTILLVADASGDESREANQTVNRLVAMAGLQGVHAEGLIQSGDIDDVILEVARQRSADLIVCEPRDRSVLDRLFNINKLVQLIGKAHCPVLVVHGAQKNGAAE
ncbi:MAG: universal stress protein [Magnetococcales bacterium]|nr:universal stress protein [Magnetococcales bacterium]